MPPKKACRARNWCFTSWEQHDWEGFIDDTISYIIVGEEICPDTNREHWQGYLECTKAVTDTAIKKYFTDKPHIEPRKGNQQQAINYCKGLCEKKKPNEIVHEYGEPKNQGRRNDLETIRTMVLKGENDFSITMEATSLQGVKCIDTIRQKLIRYRDHDERPTVTWLWGETGVGKSRQIKEMYGNDYDDCDYANGFLIGYTGNKTVVFDDYRGQIPLHRLLKMLDYGKCTVNVKGGSCAFGAMNIYFTSCKPPEDCYANVADENIRQLTRRIDVCTEVGGAQKSGVILNPSSVHDEPEEEIYVR